MIVQLPITVNIEGVPDTFDADEFTRRMQYLLRKALDGECKTGEVGSEGHPHDPDLIITRAFGPLALFAIVAMALEQLEKKGASEDEALRQCQQILTGTEIGITITPPRITQH